MALQAGTSPLQLTRMGLGRGRCATVQLLTLYSLILSSKDFIYLFFRQGEREEEGEENQCVKWNTMQQKGAPTLCDSRDGTGEHDAK